ncbi:TLC domain [Carpediemonas membranifera]|uniref:TLC domain n=1 Tax=Carpediemonas membranifera TaxID=201153 RepID=A0A8J6B316_9EUKA|nr:TLC domain [Carpediemonas membranifera]|eukprot:KAG9393214.1 TLC domain [Carpediemonas membranifera]
MLPKHIFLPLIFHGPELNGGVMPLHRSLSVFFSLLYCLHVMWSYMILKMIFGIVFGSVRGDIRSDTEEPSKKKSSKKVE